MIRADGLTRRYGEITAVDQVSFSIRQGEIVGLLGHNGAGKTTIMKMLTGYLEPSSGSIDINGLDPVCHSLEVRQQIGYLPENCPVYPEMTVIEYLDYTAGLHNIPTADRPEQLRQAIARTGLVDRAFQPISTLSRGYRQRVGVAQAILHHPRLLILDEPTHGLDPTQVQHMRGLIRSLAQQATVIISTHILQEVQAICDRVIIIRNGQKALDATMEELQAGKRLLVAVDAAPEQAVEPLKAVTGVVSVESVAAQGPGHRYALDLEEVDDPAEAAPGVADRIAAEGWKLFALQPERRDLEEIFGEISAREGVAL